MVLLAWFFPAILQRGADACLVTIPVYIHALVAKWNPPDMTVKV